MTKKVEYKDLIDLSGGDIAKKGREEGLFKELSAEEKDELLNFSRMDVKGRQEFIDSIEGTEPPPGPGDGTPPAEEPQDDLTPPPVEDIVPPVTDDLTPPAEPAPGEEPTDEKTDLLKNYAETEEALRVQRASARELGAKNKLLEQQMAEAQKKINNFEEQNAPPPTPQPNAPKPPKSADYDEGVYDEKYTKELDQFNADLVQYQTDLVEWQKTNEPESIKSLRDEIKQLKSQIEPAFNYAQQQQHETVKKKVNTQWEGMWNHAGELQKRLGLETSVNIQTINNYADIARNPAGTDGNPLYTTTEVAQAATYMKNLGKKDHASYKALVPILNECYDFEGGTPKKRFGDMDDTFVIQHAVKKHGIKISEIKELELSPQERADALAKKQREDSQTLSGMSADQIGTNDEQLGADSTKEEKQQRLMDMTKTIHRNAGLIKKGNPSYDQEFTEKFEKLKAELYPR